jgi:hypothetical protein
MDVFARGFLLGARGGELLRRLEATADALKKTDQDAGRDVPGMDNVAAGLAHASILHSRDADVRLLAVVGLVDVLRVYAPDAPFSTEQVLVRSRAARGARRASGRRGVRAARRAARGALTTLPSIPPPSASLSRTFFARPSQSSQCSAAAGAAGAAAAAAAAARTRRRP